MDIAFGLSAFERVRGGQPQLPVVNMFAEGSEVEKTGIVLQSRPGLSEYITMGTGPIRELFSGDNILDDGIYGVSGNGLYAGTTLLGLIDGNGQPSMAAYADLLFVAAGGGLWSWDMSTLVSVAFPDAANVRKVVVGASRLICIREDTERFYWSDVLSSSIDALSFATAESQPDRLRDALFQDGILVLFGAETVEFWPNTGDADLPFQPLPGRVFERGIKATGCATIFGSTFAWVTNDGQVCVSDPDNIISNPGLEALIEASDTVRLQTFRLEGTEFLALRIDAGTWVFSERPKMWSQFTSAGLENWLVQCHSRGFFGSGVDGKIYRWGSGHLDAGEVLERRFRAGVWMDSGSLTLNNLILRTNPGNTPYLAGDYADATVEVRLSRDGGRTWGNWKPASLGTQGEYRSKVQWTGLGMFGQPGMLAEFRVTDPVDFRVSGVLANEPFGGL